METKLQNLVKQVGTDVSGKWIATEKVEQLAKLIVQEYVKNLETHSTCFDGDVSRGIKIAARLTKEHFGME